MIEPGAAPAAESRARTATRPSPRRRLSRRCGPFATRRHAAAETGGIRVPPGWSRHVRRGRSVGWRRRHARRVDVRALVAPARCLSCRAPGPVVCGACDAALVRLDGPRCGRCGRPTLRATEACRECAGRRLAFASARGAVTLAGPAHALMRAWKDRGMRSAAEVAAALVVAVVDAPPAPAVLVPVPALRARAAWRGGDGAASLAASLAEAWQLELAGPLRARRQPAAARSRPGRSGGATPAPSSAPPVASRATSCWSTTSTPRVRRPTSAPGCCAVPAPRASTWSRSRGWSDGDAAERPQRRSACPGTRAGSPMPRASRYTRAASSVASVAWRALRMSGPTVTRPWLRITTARTGPRSTASSDRAISPDPGVAYGTHGRGPAGARGLLGQHQRHLVEHQAEGGGVRRVRVDHGAVAGPQQRQVARQLAGRGRAGAVLAVGQAHLGDRRRRWPRGPAGRCRSRARCPSCAPPPRRCPRPLTTMPASPSEVYAAATTCFEDVDHGRSSSRSRAEATLISMPTALKRITSSRDAPLSVPMCSMRRAKRSRPPGRSVSSAAHAA